jgi:hypothetical protein
LRLGLPTTKKTIPLATVTAADTAAKAVDASGANPCWRHALNSFDQGTDNDNVHRTDYYQHYDPATCQKIIKGPSPFPFSLSLIFVIDPCVAARFCLH